MWHVLGCRIIAWPELINGVKNMAKVKTRFQLDNVRNLVALPTAEDPPAGVGINKDSPALFEILFDRGYQVITGPAPTRADRFPITFAHSSPVIYGDCLRSRNHYCIARQLWSCVYIPSKARAIQ